jgi:preprotein translocase subunit YajC
VEVEIADGVKVRVIRSTISQVLSKTEPAGS